MFPPPSGGQRGASAEPQNRKTAKPQNRKK